MRFLNGIENKEEQIEEAHREIGRKSRRAVVAYWTKVFAFSLALHAGIFQYGVVPYLKSINVIEKDLDDFLSELAAAIEDDPDFLKTLDFGKLFVMLDFYNNAIDKKRVVEVNEEFGRKIEKLEKVKDNTYTFLHEVSQMMGRYVEERKDMSSLLVDYYGGGKDLTGNCDARAKLALALISKLRPDLEVRVQAFNGDPGHVRVVVRVDGKWFHLENRGVTSFDFERPGSLYYDREGAVKLFVGLEASPSEYFAIENGVFPVFEASSSNLSEGTKSFFEKMGNGLDTAEYYGGLGEELEQPIYREFDGIKEEVVEVIVDEKLSEGENSEVQEVSPVKDVMQERDVLESLDVGQIVDDVDIVEYIQEDIGAIGEEKDGGEPFEKVDNNVVADSGAKAVKFKVVNKSVTDYSQYGSMQSGDLRRILKPNVLSNGVKKIPECSEERKKDGLCVFAVGEDQVLNMEKLAELKNEHTAEGDLFLAKNELLDGLNRVDGLPALIINPGYNGNLISEEQFFEFVEGEEVRAGVEYLKALKNGSSEFQSVSVELYVPVEIRDRARFVKFLDNLPFDEYGMDNNKLVVGHHSRPLNVDEVEYLYDYVIRGFKTVYLVNPVGGTIISSKDSSDCRSVLTRYNLITYNGDRLGIDCNRVEALEMSDASKLYFENNSRASLYREGCGDFIDASEARFHCYAGLTEAKPYAIGFDNSWIKGRVFYANRRPVESEREGQIDEWSFSVGSEVYSFFEGYSSPGRRYIDGRSELIATPQEERFSSLLDFEGVKMNNLIEEVGKIYNPSLVLNINLGIVEELSVEGVKKLLEAVPSRMNVNFVFVESDFSEGLYEFIKLPEFRNMKLSSESRLFTFHSIVIDKGGVDFDELLNRGYRRGDNGVWSYRLDRMASGERIMSREEVMDLFYEDLILQNLRPLILKQYEGSLKTWTLPEGSPYHSTLKDIMEANAYVASFEGLEKFIHSLDAKSLSTVNRMEVKKLVPVLDMPYLDYYETEEDAKSGDVTRMKPGLITLSNEIFKMKSRNGILIKSNDNEFLEQYLQEMDDKRIKEQYKNGGKVRVELKWSIQEGADAPAAAKYADGTADDLNAEWGDRVKKAREHGLYNTYMTYIPSQLLRSQNDELGTVTDGDFKKTIMVGQELNEVNVGCVYWSSDARSLNLDWVFAVHKDDLASVRAVVPVSP